jgi:hypothetical protein
MMPASIGPGSVHYDIGHPPADLKNLVCKACSVQPQTPDATPIGNVIMGDPDPIVTLMGCAMNFGQFKTDVLWMNRLWGENTSNVKTWGDFIAWVKTCYSFYHA